MNQRSFARTLDSLEPLYEFVNQFLTGHSIDKKTAFEMQLAIEEVFANSVEHNHASKAGVTLSLDKSGDCITIKIEDFDVPEFDVSKPPNVNTAAPIEERRIGGLGLHLIHKIMDRVEYHHENRISTITLIKYVK
jgi:anti-sigma regulatory factor (Ser/Thr protein kinase)